jgi:hypothetical protein
MKSCPSCNRTYTDASLNFCLEDGTPLVNSAAPGFDPNATIRYTDPRETKTPPPPEVYRAPAPPVYQANVPTTSVPVTGAPATSHGSQFGQQQPSLAGPGAQAKKTSVVWWVLGGILVVGVIGVGAVIMVIALASMGSNSNANSNRNTNSRTANRNANTNTNVANTNTNATVPSSLIDDFSESKWGIGTFEYGDIWYADGQYHMRSKENKYLLMYAPSTDYKTGNATVHVTTRSVDGTSPATGYGLVVHGQRSKTGQPEDYVLLIYTGAEPKYEILKHKDGQQTALVPWFQSTVIRSGTNTNQLEVRARGSELSFYINGQFVRKIKDTENFGGGVAGLYTSDGAEIVFDDLEIKR